MRNIGTRRQLSSKKRREKKREAESQMTDDERAKLVMERRRKVNAHVKNHRQRKKDAQKKAIDSGNALSDVGEIIANSYSNKQTLRKAVKKASNALPKSPTKKKVVLAKMVDNLDDDARNEVINIISIAPKRSSSCSVMIKDIHDFYERDDISRMSLKMKHVKKYTCSVFFFLF